MAGVFKVTCNCGHETSVGIGFTRMMCREHKTNFPVLCRACETIGTSIFFDGELDSDSATKAAEPICSNCESTNIVRYDDPQLRKKDDETLFDKAETGQRSGDYIELTEGVYFCPACRDFALRFEDSGIIAC